MSQTPEGNSFHTGDISNLINNLQDYNHGVT